MKHRPSIVYLANDLAFLNVAFDNQDFKKSKRYIKDAMRDFSLYIEEEIYRAKRK